MTSERAPTKLYDLEFEDLTKLKKKSGNLKFPIFWEMFFIAILDVPLNSQRSQPRNGMEKVRRIDIFNMKNKRVHHLLIGNKSLEYREVMAHAQCVF